MRALGQYLAAMDAHDRAGRIMDDAERLFRRLLRQHDDKTAYYVAGVNFADRRSLLASAAEREALKALAECLAAAPTAERAAIDGLVAWHREARRGNRKPDNANGLKSCRRTATR